MNDALSKRALWSSCRLSSVCLLAVWFLCSSQAYGFDLKPSEIRGESSKKPVSVLQNRYFLKAWRPEVGLMAGTVLDEAYLDTAAYGGRVGLFVNEWIGFEVQAIQTSISDSDDRKALQQLEYRPKDSSSADATAPDVEEEVYVSPDPEVNAVLGLRDVNTVFAPFYGKLNIMNQMIVYTDLYLTAGYSSVETDQGGKNAIALGIGERFYIGKAWSVRIDYRDRIYTESRAGRETTKHLQTVDLGAGYFFK